MKNYFIESPRGFCNENTIYSANIDNAEEMAFIKEREEVYSDDPNGYFYRITRREAESWTANERKLYRERCGTNWGAMEITPISERIEYLKSIGLY